MFSAAGSRITRQPKFRPGDPASVVAEFQQMAKGNTLYLGRGVATAPRFEDVSEDGHILPSGLRKSSPPTANASDDTTLRRAA